MIKKHLYSLLCHATVLTAREGEDEAAAAAALQAKIDAAVAAAVAAETAGLKAKNEELLGKNKTLAERARSFDGLDPEALKALKDRLDQDEDAKLLAEGKKNVVIEKYTERMRAQHELDKKALQDQIAAEGKRADTYRQSVLDSHILRAAGSLHKGAVEDALLHARNLFTLDAAGNAVQLDSEGRPVLGKDGTTPFSPAEWIELQKELKPHWFPMNTSGSGGGNAREAGGAGKQIKRADFDRLQPYEQAEKARSGITIVD
jgi:hypothetical protein